MGGTEDRRGIGLKMWKQLWIKVWRIWDLITVNNYEKLLLYSILAFFKEVGTTQEVEIFGSRVFELIYLNFFLPATKLICILCTVSINTIFVTPTSFPSTVYVCPHSLTHSSIASSTRLRGRRK